MADRFRWKAEVEFEGTVDEFNQFSAVMNDLPVAVRFPDWLKPRPIPGIWPIAIDVLLGEDLFNKYIDGMPRLNKLRYIKDIYGGIRIPHLHIGDDIVLLDRARFKAVLGNVAQLLAERRVEAIDDFAHVMDGLAQLVGGDPIPIP